MTNNPLENALKQPKKPREEQRISRSVKFTAVLSGRYPSLFDKIDMSVRQRVPGMGKGSKVAMLKWFIDRLDDDPSLFEQMVKDLREQNGK